ncbi:MAG: DNA-primase RepB domain-containing protein, partial [Candidatus Igneacidithiobacillus chanchocoensis]
VPACRARARAARGRGAACRAAQAHPWLFIDDLDTARLLALTAKIGGLAIETSAGNGQARLLADRLMTQDERGQAQKTLRDRLGGDKGSVSGEKWGRLPGFTSQKPGKSGQWTNVLADTTGIRPAVHAYDLLFLAPPVGGVRAPAVLAVSSPSPASDRPKAGPQAASLVSLERSATKAGYARDALQRSAPDANEGRGGYRADMADACQSLRAGIPRDEIAQAIATRTLARGKRRTEAEAQRYAEATLRAAETSTGLHAA